MPIISLPVSLFVNKAFTPSVIPPSNATHRLRWLRAWVNSACASVSSIYTTSAPSGCTTLRKSLLQHSYFLLHQKSLQRPHFEAPFHFLTPSPNPQKHRSRIVTFCFAVQIKIRLTTGILLASWLVRGFKSHHQVKLVRNG